MLELKAALRQQWLRSTWFRVGLALGVLYVLLRGLIAFAWVGGYLDIPDWPPDNDLQTYLRAGESFWDHEDLYYEPQDNFRVYVYSPAFALLSGVLTLVPYQLAAAVMILLHLLGYGLLYWRWFMIFQRLHMKAASEQMIRFLPLWLVFTPFLFDVTYLNVYIFMALLGTLLLEAVLKEQLGFAVLWLTVLLPIKPHWAFALAVPLVLGRWRFFAKLTVAGALTYLATMGITLLVGGNYAWEQYRAYIQTLQAIPETFPWNTLTQHGHIGYNHSVMQMVAFYLNDGSAMLWTSMLIKALLLFPLMIIVWKHLRQPLNKPGQEVPQISLEIAFAFYFAAFLLVDVISEVMLGALVFIYLQSVLKSRPARLLISAAFWPYALMDLWATVAGGTLFVIELPDVVLYPDLFVPVMLILMLAFYAVLIGRLWGTAAWKQAQPYEVHDSRGFEQRLPDAGHTQAR